MIERLLLKKRLLHQSLLLLLLQPLILHFLQGSIQSIERNAVVGFSKKIEKEGPRRRGKKEKRKKKKEKNVLGFNRVMMVTFIESANP